MFLTKSRKANLDTTDAAARARAAGKAAQVAAQNAASAARAAAASAQVAAQNAAQKSTAAAQVAAQKSTEVAQKSQTAAQNASSTAQTTAAGVSKQVQHRVYTARKWAAPRLESVADYTTTTVAPTVSSALRNTAAQVRPAEPVSPKRRMTSVLTWSLLGAAIAAAAGAAAALVRYRRRAATSVDSEMPDSVHTETATDAASKPTGQTSPVSTPTVPKPTGPGVSTGKANPSASANQTETVTDASVNGHANTNGW